MGVLDPTRVRLHRDVFERLILTIDGACIGPVQPIRSFPLSDPEAYISLRDPDGKERGLLEHIDKLDPESAEALRITLADAYFLPVIRRIINVELDGFVPIWSVETDRGPHQFELRSRHDARFISPVRVLIRDADGNRYDIPDYTALDPVSRAIIEREV